MANPTGTQRSAYLLTRALIDADINPVIVDAPRVKPPNEGLADNLNEFYLHGKWSDHIQEQILWPMVRRHSVLLTLMGTGPVLHPSNRHVMLVHDLNFLLIPKAFSTSFRLWYRFASCLAIKRADLIVCFSNYVKQSLVRILRVDPSKIRVISPGPGLPGLELRAPSIAPPVADEPPYFLCVGSLQPHKNLKAILSAWHRFQPENPEFRLKIVGRKQARFSELSLPAKLFETPGIEFTGYATDEHLRHLYERACGFLYPSFEEGFGLPVLEAFYCGCPVITSNVSCLPEVAGGAAMLISPDSIDALHQCMAVLAGSPSERLRLQRAGFARSQGFRWDRAGRELASVLDPMRS